MNSCIYNILTKFVYFLAYTEKFYISINYQEINLKFIANNAPKVVYFATTLGSSLCSTQEAPQQ